jgi:hypothetical protein
MPPCAHTLDSHSNVVITSVADGQMIAWDYASQSWVNQTPSVSGHTIQNQGTPLTARANLNFYGAGVVASDDPGNDATLVTIDGGGGSGTDADAIHVNVASEITGIAPKATLANDDAFVIEDSADSDNKKSTLWGTIVSVLTGIFDLLYAAIGHTHAGSCFKYSTDLTGGSTSEVVTHNLNSRDVIVKVYLVGSPYTQVECEIDHTTVNTVTIKMANAIAGSTYRVVVIG